MLFKCKAASTNKDKCLFTSCFLLPGNNVRIGGGSGVIKDIEDNQTVMGYPAVPLREFLKEKK